MCIYFFSFLHFLLSKDAVFNKQPGWTFHFFNKTYPRQVLFNNQRIRWGSSVYSSNFLSFEVDGSETQTDRPVDNLITEMKDWEIIKDKKIKEMTKWKKVIAASSAELLIRSDRILRNAQRYEETGWRVSFPIQLFSLHLAPLTSCILALSVTSTFPWASYRGQDTASQAHLWLLEYSVTYMIVEGHILCCHLLSVTLFLPPYSRHFALKELCHTQCVY